MNNPETELPLNAVAPPLPLLPPPLAFPPNLFSVNVVNPETERHPMPFIEEEQEFLFPSRFYDTNGNLKVNEVQSWYNNLTEENRRNRTARDERQADFTLAINPEDTTPIL